MGPPLPQAPPAGTEGEQFCQSSSSDGLASLQRLNVWSHGTSLLLSLLFTFCNAKDGRKTVFPANMTKCLGVAALCFHACMLFVGGGALGYESQLKGGAGAAKGSGWIVVCQAQATLLQFSATSMVCWIVLIQFTVFHVVVRHTPMAAIVAWRGRFQRFAFGVPAAFALLPLLCGVYGADSGFFACWFSRNFYGAYQFAFNFVWCLAADAAILYWSGRIIPGLARVRRAAQAQGGGGDSGEQGGGSGLLGQMVRNSAFAGVVVAALTTNTCYSALEYVRQRSGGGGGHAYSVCAVTTVNVGLLGTYITAVFLPSHTNWRLLSTPCRRLRRRWRPSARGGGGGGGGGGGRGVSNSGEEPGGPGGAWWDYTLGQGGGGYRAEGGGQLAPQQQHEQRRRQEQQQQKQQRQQQQQQQQQQDGNGLQAGRHLGRGGELATDSTEFPLHYDSSVEYSRHTAGGNASGDGGGRHARVSSYGNRGSGGSRPGSTAEFLRGGGDTGEFLRGGAGWANSENNTFSRELVPEVRRRQLEDDGDDGDYFDQQHGGGSPSGGGAATRSPLSAAAMAGRAPAVPVAAAYYDYESEDDADYAHTAEIIRRQG